MYELIFYLYVLVCHSYISRMYSYVICMSLICYRYVTHMYSYVMRVSLVCTRMSSVIRVSLPCIHMSSVCHSYVHVCHPYVTPMYSHVIHMSLVGARMSLVGGLTMNHSRSKKFVLETETKSLKNTFKEIHILAKFQAPCLQLYNN